MRKLGSQADVAQRGVGFSGGARPMTLSTTLAASAFCVTAALGAPALASGPTVVAVITHPVADYEAWRPYYDKWEPARRQAGMVSQTVLRGADDPNVITLIHMFETIAGAESLFAMPELKQDMSAAGVLGKPVITMGVITE